MHAVAACTQVCREWRHWVSEYAGWTDGDFYQCVEGGSVHYARLINNVTGVIARSGGQGVYMLRAVTRRDADMVRYLLTQQYVYHVTDMMHAVNNGDLEIVKLLLADPRVDIKSRKNYVIKYAAMMNQGEIYNYMLEYVVSAAPRAE